MNRAPVGPAAPSLELPASDPVLTPLANAPAQEAQSPTESTEFVWEMTGGAPNPPFFFHTGLRHMAWKDFGGSHNSNMMVDANCAIAIKQAVDTRRGHARTQELHRATLT